MHADTATALRARLADLRRRSDTPHTTLVALDANPGPRATRDALFLPARARQTHRALFYGATVHIDVDEPDPPPRLTFVADDTADRQRRRKTWAQDVARHALDDAARVMLDIACHPRPSAVLGRHVSREAQGGAAI